MLAGGIVKNNNYKNTTFWLHTGQTYWTMTPSRYQDVVDWAFVFRVYSSGYLDDYEPVHTWSDGGVRPVINMKSNTVFLAGGTGTVENPYIVKV